MADNEITLTAAQMKQLARYEITFKDVLNHSAFEETHFVCPEVCSFTLSDLYQAIKNLKAADPEIAEFGTDWFFPITQLSKAFDLDRATGSSGTGDPLPKSEESYPGLKTTEKDWFSSLWQALEDAWIDGDDGAKLSAFLDFDEALSGLERFFSNQGKPIEAWSFSKGEMEAYIRLFREEDCVKKADAQALALARRFIDRLCGEGSALAIDLKGYACYGGNRLYACDWNTSRDCMLRLYEMTDEPRYANTLGYIYYYGRCNGGLPEYDKAFHYFGIAAANGLYEGMYKLADMYRHGYACKQSPKTARALYRMVYADSLKDFLWGRHANFADAALRMGNVFAKGIGEDEAPLEAFCYYLQADYAAKLRAQDDDFFGNATVVTNVQKALEETRSKLPEDFFQDVMHYALPFLFRQLAEDNNRCALRRITDGEGSVRLIANRLPTRSVPQPQAILITIPQLGFCTRTTEVSFAVDDSAEIWFRNGADSVRFDACAWNSVESRCEYYLDDALVAWSKSESYRFCEPPSQGLL